MPYLLDRETEEKRYYCDHGFHYEITFEFYYSTGMAIAREEGEFISSVTFSKLTEPTTDDDWQWERYEHEKAEFRDEAIHNLEDSIKEYINN